MIIARSKKDLDHEISSRKENGDRIGFVPTMGALHEGHLSLINIAREHSDFVVASIFVNPTQFAPHEDFDSYPRNEDQDAANFKKAGVDLVYIPSTEDIYPNNDRTQWVKTEEAAKGLETDFRPHFFDGVVNVVHRLFKQVTPDVAIFGEKDYQQLQVIRESVDTVGIPVEIIGGPIIRDKHGLALSSRNAYLSDSELDTARMLNKTLKEVAHNKDFEAAKDILITIGFDKVDYIEERWGRILGAAWIDKTRLIDNVPVK